MQGIYCVNTTKNTSQRSLVRFSPMYSWNGSHFTGHEDTVRNAKAQKYKRRDGQEECVNCFWLQTLRQFLSTLISHLDWEFKSIFFIQEQDKVFQQGHKDKSDAGHYPNLEEH